MLPGIESQKTAPYGMSSLALAHIGDAVYELLVRSHLCAEKRTASGLHAATVRLVCAPAQALAAQTVLHKLSDIEKSVFMRARNAKVSHVPKGATASQYNLATALEALFGYLYLNGESSRIEQLFTDCWNTLQETENRLDQG